MLFPWISAKVQLVDKHDTAGALELARKAFPRGVALNLLVLQKPPNRSRTLIRPAISDTFTSILVVESRQRVENRFVKKAWVFCCIVASSAIVGGCGKGGSQNATEASGASASQAPVQPAQGASDIPSASGALGAIAKAQLPGEAAETLRLIKAGGPYPFSEDGVVFRNSALLLPKHPRGYYHAYTVRTPGSTDRGQRRIVCGGPRRQTGECYYTDDYYVSFKRIGE
jgi:ribonuclease T1